MGLQQRGDRSCGNNIQFVSQQVPGYFTTLRAQGLRAEQWEQSARKNVRAYAELGHLGLESFSHLVGKEGKEARHAPTPPFSTESEETSDLSVCLMNSWWLLYESN